MVRKIMRFASLMQVYLIVLLATIPLRHRRTTEEMILNSLFSLALFAYVFTAGKVRENAIRETQLEQVLQEKKILWDASTLWLTTLILAAGITGTFFLW